MRHIAPLERLVRSFGILLVAAAWFWFGVGDAAASISLSASPLTTTASAGSTDNAFDVILTNSGPSSVDLGAFAFELSVSSPFITFTEATTATSSPYIFAGSSAFGPTISFSAPGSVLDASDLSTLLSGITLGSGDTVGLGHVLFDVSSSATTSTALVTFAPFPSTNLSDPDGNDVPIDSLSSEVTIQLQGSEGQVPEPSTFTIYGIGIGLAAAVGVCRRYYRRLPIVR